jgi:hypothetical protein
MRLKIAAEVSHCINQIYYVVPPKRKPSSGITIYVNNKTNNVLSSIAKKYKKNLGIIGSPRYNKHSVAEKILEHFCTGYQNGIYDGQDIKNIIDVSRSFVSVLQKNNVKINFSKNVFVSATIHYLAMQKLDDNIFKNLYEY